jgi:hypothetical protein
MNFAIVLFNQNTYYLALGFSFCFIVLTTLTFLIHTKMRFYLFIFSYSCIRYIYEYIIIKYKCVLGLKQRFLYFT